LQWAVHFDPDACASRLTFGRDDDRGTTRSVVPLSSFRWGPFPSVPSPAVTG
jgi:hypothetical protein